MSTQGTSAEAQNRLAAVPLARDPLRQAVEQLVSAYRGKPWRVTEARDLIDYASHPCAILSDGHFAIFAKFSDAADGQDQFEIEIARLRLLADRAAVRIPAPIGVIPVANGSLLVLEAVNAVERTADHWRDIGRTLARLHKIKGQRFGLESDGYFGPLYQDNTPMDDWPRFYAERRLLPMLKLASDSGNISAEVCRQVETLIARFPDLCGPTIQPTLIHGDAQQNNFISTDAGTVIIDPAAYYGHPEMDLAILDYFQPVPQDVFDGYRDELPIDPGFEERRELWRLWSHLAVVSVAGGEYVGKLIEAVQQYA